MKTLTGWTFFIITGLFFFNSCIDAPSFDDVPTISNARVLLSSDAVDASSGSTDSVVLVFDFSDGDGDIGYLADDPEYLTFDTLFLETDTVDFIDSSYVIDPITMDTTDTLYDTTFVLNELVTPFYNLPDHVYLYRKQFDFTDSVNFKIPYLPMQGGVPDITGTVYITITNSTFSGPCPSPLVSDIVDFEMSIKDRAGNRSNTIAFPTINVNCP